MRVFPSSDIFFRL